MYCDSTTLNSLPYGHEVQSYIENIKEIQKHLSLDFHSIKKLVEIDRGKPGAHQKTLGLVAVFQIEQGYTLINGQLAVSKEIYPTDLEEIACNPSKVEIPEYIEIESLWDEKTEKDCENLFGDTVRLFVNQQHLRIPCIKATDELLSYYGARIIPEGVPFKFPVKEFPVFKMSVGENWFSEGVQNDEFGGVFLEYHHDQPHFHMVYEEGSFYILAKWKDAAKTKLQITAFELPPKVGIYTKKGAIHCDSALKGDVLNGYMLTEDFSVAFLRNNPEENKRVTVEI
jgi:hypothetical protein